VWRPGDLVDGRFVLERAAGAGGRGAVWRAVDVRKRDAVALKLVSGPADSDPLVSVRGEIDALAHVTHDAVVGCRGFGRADEHTAYLALTWIDGEPLSARIARRTLTVAATLTLGRRIVDALAAIHAAGLVHGDLKPANVLLPGGDPAAAVVVDLGITRVAQAAPATGEQPAGTAPYMAPEALRGEPIDGRADLFALGAVLHEALAGKPAFAGDSAAAVVTRILFGEPDSLAERRPDAPAELIALIDALLARDPSVRLPDAVTVRGRLAAITPPGAEDDVAIGGDEVRPVAAIVVAGLRDLDAEAIAARRLLGPAARVVRDGDRLVIAFDGGVATDRAAAAARAAAALHAATGARIGVASGTAVIHDESIHGDAVATAARLADGVAAAGGVALDDETGELAARGDGQRTVLGRATPLCGRDRELAMLVALADECAEESIPRAALVTAPPGIGKSRLRRELARKLAARPGQTVWLGRGEAVREGAPLAIIADVVRASLGEAANGRATLRAAVEARGLADAGRVSDFLGELLGLDDSAPSPQLISARGDPILMNDQLRRAVVDWLDSAAAAAPLAILLEDLHWGDGASLRFLEAALRQLKTLPILVVAFGRPAMLELFPGLFANHHPVTLRLGPLPARATAQLVRAALPDAADDVVARLVERGAGNPFYVEELVRQVAAGKDQLPATVVSMVQARLDDLAAAERRVLRAASVLGPRFVRGAVAALLGLPSADLDLESQLAALVRRELLVHRRPSAIPADDELAFSHDLIREAADALSTAEDRAAAHRAAAAWWEQRTGADPSVLASHWERGDAPARAATWHRRAAEVALAANDFAAALASLRRAAELGAPASAAADLCAADAHAWRGEVPDAAAAADAAMRDAPVGSVAWWRGLGIAVTARGRAGDLDAVRALAARALATPPAADAGAAFLSSLCAVGRQLFHAARYGDAEEIIALVSAHAGDLAALPPLVAAAVHGLYAAAARHRGDLADDLAGYRQVLAAFEAAGDRRSACNTRVSVAFARIELGDWAPAQRDLEDALAEAERLGLAPVATRARQNLSLCLLHRGELAAAAAILDRVVTESREQENSRFEGWTRVYRARVALAAGDVAVARQHARAACVLLDGSPPALAGARSVLAQVLIAEGKPAEAVALAAESVAVVDALGGVEEFEAIARLTLVLAHDAAGDAAARDAALARAVARLEERAAAIGDAALRASFVDAVDENRQTGELASRWLPMVH
jgi:tetratricopeptide (TPR) repeat protein